MSSLPRREFITLTALAGLAGCMPRDRRLAVERPAERPNILFIMSDDHAAHAISAYGSRINTTPNLDRLAAEGVRFDHCFVNNSLCAPSRACILTGKFSHKNGHKTNADTFDGSQSTYPKLLQAAGYQTILIGKWHLVSEPTGFDYWNILPGQGEYHDPHMIEMGKRVQYPGYVTDILTDKAIDYLDQRRNREKPFCMMLWHKAPHRNWEPDDKHAAMYADGDVPTPETFDDDWSHRASPAANTTMTIARDLTTSDTKGDPPAGLSPEAEKKWKYERFIKDYLRCVASVDDNLGRLMDYLRKSGLADNTLVVYTSDQGFFLGDHGWFDKRFMYEESLRMPLIVRYPRMAKQGSVCKAMVQNADFAPTFLSLAGAAVPADVQGRSLLPLLSGRTPADWRKAVYYHYYEYPAVHSVRRHYGVRTERYTLIHYYHQMDEWELFDLEKDPHELVSVYDDPAYGDVVKELKAELSRLRTELGDTDDDSGIAHHPDFDMAYDVQIEKVDNGYILTGNPHGYALKKTAAPFRRRARFHGQLAGARAQGLRNGLFCFGATSDAGNLEKCGVYIGAGDCVILHGPFAGREEDIVRLPMQFDKSKTFDVTVDVDLVEREIALTVDGKTLTAPLKKRWSEINYYGYAVFGARTRFGRIEVEGR